MFYFCVQSCAVKKTCNVCLFLAFAFFFQIEELQNKLVEAETDKNVSLDQLQQKELEIQKLVSEINCKSLRVYFLLVLGKAAVGSADEIELHASIPTIMSLSSPSWNYHSICNMMP